MDNIVKFDKPYKFEGKEYDSLDLSGMEKMTVQDLIDIRPAVSARQPALTCTRPLRWQPPCWLWALMRERLEQA